MLSIKLIAEERALVLHVLVSLYCIQRYLIINYQQNLIFPFAVIVDFRVAECHGITRPDLQRFCKIKREKKKNKKIVNASNV